MGARLNPLTVVITTASDKETAPFVEMLKMYKAILRGEIENDSIFAHIFEPDIDDEEGDPATWRKVQPHMGITVYEDFYIDAYQKALYSAPDALEFRTKLLNVFAVDSTTKWIEAKQIEERFKGISIENIGTYPLTMRRLIYPFETTFLRLPIISIRKKAALFIRIRITIFRRSFKGSSESGTLRRLGGSRYLISL